jgi:hypothetical protein
VGANPGNENRPDIYCRLPTIFTINGHGVGANPVHENRQEPLFS